MIKKDDVVVITLENAYGVKVGTIGIVVLLGYQTKKSAFIKTEELPWSSCFLHTSQFEVIGELA